MCMTLAELESVAEALRQNNMVAYCVASKEKVVPLVKKLLRIGDTVAVGGSVTLFETGVIDLLRSLVVGCNKIVDDIPAAVRRVKTVAAPLNAKRLQCHTYCAVNGVCKAVDSERYTDGCRSPARICAQYLISGQQRIPGRIQVILVAEPLGF
ncbi:MAG: LUD domain-containing protein [Clostridia bacterium]|nr:LUD domain-containing protein [Clostridia bacterium]